MKQLLIIAVLVAITVLQQGCHLSARADIFYKSENGGQLWKSRPNSSTGGSGNATDKALRSFFKTK